MHIAPSNALHAIDGYVWLTAEAQEFKKKFEEAQEINAQLIGTPATAEPDEEDEAADELAEQVAKASV